MGARFVPDAVAAECDEGAAVATTVLAVALRWEAGAAAIVGLPRQNVVDRGAELRGRLIRRLLAERDSLDRLLDGVHLQLPHLRDGLMGILIRPRLLQLIHEERERRRIPWRLLGHGNAIMLRLLLGLYLQET